MSGRTRSCGRQTARSRRSGERSYDSYFANDAKAYLPLVNEPLWPLPLTSYLLPAESESGILRHRRNCMPEVTIQMSQKRGAYYEGSPTPLWLASYSW